MTMRLFTIVAAILAVVLYAGSLYAEAHGLVNSVKLAEGCLGGLAAIYGGGGICWALWKATE